MSFVAAANCLAQHCRDAVCPGGLEHEQFEQRIRFLYETLPAWAGRMGVRLFDGAHPNDGASLDTGDAGVPPFAPAVDALRAAADRIADYGKYLGPFARSDIRPAVLGFLSRRRILVHPSPDLAVTVGCGTVNLWDAVVRVLVRRPGDTVVAPAPTYGFFLPHVLQRRGRVAVLDRVSSYPKVTPGELGQLIDRENRQRRARWVSTVGPHLRFELDHLGDETGRCVNVSRWWLAQARSIIASLPLAAPATAVDAQLRTQLADLSVGGRRVPLSEPDINRLVARVGPPRVVAMLHMNPDLVGNVYGAGETAALADVLGARGVVAVEDLAYHHLLPWPDSAPAQLCSILNFDRTAVCLFGLSKPLAIANLRLGAALASADRIADVARQVERSVGFVPNASQSVIAAALSEDADGPLMDYLSANSKLYAARHALLVRCLLGTAGRSGPDGDAAYVRQVCHSACRQSSAHSPARVRVGSDIVEVFVTTGLSNWLRVVEPRTQGFFVLADATAAIDVCRAAGIRIQGAFDLTALLYAATGVRVIAEEGMTVTTGRETGTLRLSISPEPEVIVRSLFAMFVLFRHVSRHDCSAQDPPASDYSPDHERATPR